MGCASPVAVAWAALQPGGNNSDFKQVVCGASGTGQWQQCFGAVAYSMMHNVKLLFEYLVVGYH